MLEKYKELIMIQRIFHPIGQGAFYSERHENINIVYDCGTEWKNRTKSIFNKVITQSFREEEIIDILFISHFDYDHVSKIEILKKHVKEIKRVILPLLHDNEKILLCNFYRALDLKILTLINEPEKYFDEKTQIIYIRPSDNDESPISDNTEIQNLDKIIQLNSENKIELKSGVKLTINGMKNWIFIPYNNRCTNKHNNLEDKLIRAGFNISKLKNDPNYTLDEICKDVSISKLKGGKKFKGIYDRLNGKVNQNSMFLYSGPMQNDKYYKHCFTGAMCQYFYKPWCYDFNYSNKVGCIYTGDGDLNIVRIKSIFSNYWKNIGTIQIPHHGDIKAFDKYVLKDCCYCCPISFGKNNSYGHPSSKVVAEILSSRSYPILVTEDLDSMYVEIIE